MNSAKTRVTFGVAVVDIARLFGMVWDTHAALSTAVITFRLVGALVPLSALWVGKLIIDEVVRDQRASAVSARLGVLLLAELALAAAADWTSRLSSLCESMLGDRFATRIEIMVMRKAAALSLSQLENPDVTDHLERARASSPGRISLITQAIAIVQDSITIALLSIALGTERFALLALLAVATVPAFISEAHIANLGFSVMFMLTPQRRRLDYISQLATSTPTAKEVRAYGLSDWLVGRYHRVARELLRRNSAIAVRRATVGGAAALIGLGAYYGAYVVILVDTAHNALTLGALTFLAGSFQRAREALRRVIASMSMIYEKNLALRDLFIFLDEEPLSNVPSARLAFPKPIRDGIEFRDVGFSYGGARWALRGINLRIAPGERIAIVGENGAGKSTVIKLLLRLYDPTEGCILVDGIDVREFDVVSLRDAMAVAFQDFVKYDMAFDENIGLGDIGSSAAYLEDHCAVFDELPAVTSIDAPIPAKITAAADQSLAAAVAGRLPRGYRQMLGRRFQGGVELSGGEWQRVALARAYARSAQVFILDEPTASLDPRAEADVFDRFRRVTCGCTAILVSHRFSTVRTADRIVVLDKGRIIQAGSHAELLTDATGVYSELFELQAAAYR